MKFSHLIWRSKSRVEPKFKKKSVREILSKFWFYSFFSLQKKNVCHRFLFYCEWMLYQSQFLFPNFKVASYRYILKVLWFIIHQIFLFAHDRSKCVMWPNILPLKLGNIQEYSPIFEIASFVKNVWRIINTIAVRHCF